MKKIFSLLAISSILLVACAKEENFDFQKEGELQYVTVGIDVAAGGLRPMTGSVVPVTKTSLSDSQAPHSEDIVCEAVLANVPSGDDTKAIDDPSTASDTAIKNLWVLQYDGTGDTAKLIGTPAYIEDYTVEANRSAKLVASTSPNTVVFLANTFDKTLPFQQNSTIAELKARRFTTQSLGTILTIDPNTADVGGGAFPDNGDYYQRLNGFVEQAITEGSTLSCALGHNACRVSVNVTNNTAGTTYPVTLTSADIENVPGCIYFLTDYDGYTSGTKVGKPTSADIVLYGMKNYYDVITWTGGDGTSSTTKSAKLYLSANESGVVTANESPKLKSMFAPTRATILRIHGTFRDGADDIPVKYTFALGEDMIKNYQLVPNGDYVYNITLNARGDKTSDGRVAYNSANGIDYTQTTVWPLSNCYICNPPAVESASATYKIPVARVDQFWGGGNYENEPNNCLGQANAWEVSVIWSDMEVKAENLVITKNTGAGKEDYFEVSVPGTTEMGNVVIGIKNNLSSDWLWSWHLWVTDYCPDDAKYLTQQGAFLAGTDTYQVSGGVVQRYAAASQGTVQKVFMDRYVGAMSAEYVGTGKGMLYYQFGRKDPFPGNADYWEGGTSKAPYVISTKANSSTDANQPCNVPYSIKNPTVFITGTYWTYKDKYNPDPYNSGIVWQDPSASNNGNKSIFDPCPPGWKVPKDGQFNVKNGSDVVNYILKCHSNIIPSGGTIGLVMGGRRNASAAAFTDVGSYINIWFSNPASASNASRLNGKAGYWAIGTGYSDNRAGGYHILPIQE